MRNTRKLDYKESLDTVVVLPIFRYGRSNARALRDLGFSKWKGINTKNTIVFTEIEDGLSCLFEERGCGTDGSPHGDTKAVDLCD